MNKKKSIWERKIFEPTTKRFISTRENEKLGDYIYNKEGNAMEYFFGPDPKKTAYYKKYATKKR